MTSSASETETNHTKPHVYIGKAPRETTVEEMYALLYNIGVQDIFNIERVSKYNHRYVSFCVTLQDPHGYGFNHQWRGGIVVEPFRNHQTAPVALCIANATVTSQSIIEYTNAMYQHPDISGGPVKTI